MSGLNRPKTQFKVRFVYHEFIEVKNSRKIYDPIPKVFYGTYATTKEALRVGMNQGLVSRSLTIRTNTNIDFKLGSKVILNGKEFNLESLAHDVNSYSATYTNKPTIFETFIALTG